MDERDLPDRPAGRFTPDTLPSAGPAYGADEPYDPASPVSQTEQEPLGGPVSDGAVVAGIREALDHSRPDLRRVNVSFDHGVAILTGTVRDEDARRQAEAAALSVKGVTAVDNDLELDLPGAEDQDSGR